MRRLLSLFSLVLLATGSAAQTDCACLWQGSFAEVQGSTDLVVSGSVVRGKGNSIDLAVDRTLRGAEHAPNIRIWLKTADYCRPEASGFPTGSQWVMALDLIDEEVPGGFSPHTPNVSYGRRGDYSLSSCGGYWLSQSGKWVTGNLVKAPRWDYNPPMTPVLIDLLADFISGKVDVAALVTASREDPMARELMLDTKAFLRQAQ